MFVEMRSDDGDRAEEPDFGIVFDDGREINGFLKLETRVFASIPTDVDVSEKKKNKQKPYVFFNYVQISESLMGGNLTIDWNICRR